MAGYEDSRYERTEEDLKDAFRILAGRKELDKISVSEITKLTGVTRSTFYNHYVDMPAFIDSMEEKILAEIFELMEKIHKKQGADQNAHYFQALCAYIKENPFLVRILTTPHANIFIEKYLSRLHQYFQMVTKHSDKTGREQEAFSYALAYSIGGVVGVLHKWAVNDLKDSPEVVASYLARLFSERDFV